MKKKPLNEFELDYIKETRDYSEYLVNSNLGFDTMSLARLLDSVKDSLTAKEK